MSQQARGTAAQRSLLANSLGKFSGLLLAALFYAFVVFVPVPILQRYFLGHPVAVAATVLFCIALGQLLARYLQIARTARQLALVEDRELVPDDLHGYCGWHASAAHPDPASEDDVADETLELSVPQRVTAWLAHLSEMPPMIAESALVRRLGDVLARQQRRGNADQLSDDLRDIADRQADADYDSLQFVRIIVWAIPMLGFLGTVIGITQTLGGLDFTDGAAAVERLKSGLYVAFDTTALGLVLSVIAIFIQFPVEKRGREVLEHVETRAGRLLPAILANSTRIDQHDPLVALRQMTLEISKTVRESVRLQAELWRQAIDDAHKHWHSAAEDSTQQLRDTLQQLLGDSFATTLKSHADSIRRVQREGAEQIDNRWQQWQTALSDNARILLSHQKTLLSQGELLADSHARACELKTLQTSLDDNVIRVGDAVSAIDQGLQTIQGSENIAVAMRTLAQAVEVLADRLPADASDATGKTKPRSRRNAA